MPEIVFLLGDARKARNDNHLRLPKGFRDAGWQVTELPHDCVRIQASKIRFQAHDPARFDLIWPLGFGRRDSFFDRMQLLHQLDQTRFVTTADALVLLHGKYRWLELMPETHASNDVEGLARVITSGGDWVVKPPAGSYGRDVQLVTAGTDPVPVLRALCGPDQAAYCIVQRYVPEIVDGETRTLVAGETVIGSYLRRPEQDLRANLSTSATALPASLTTRDADLVHRLAAELHAAGVGFAAIDTANGYLMEVNVANPGGLATMETLYGKDPTPAAIAAIIAGKSGVRVKGQS